MNSKRTIENVLEADKLHRQGFSYRDIGHRMGVAGSTIKYWLDARFAEKRRGKGKQDETR